MRWVGGLVAGWLLMVIVGAIAPEHAYGYWPLGLVSGLGLAVIFALLTPRSRT